MHITDAVIGKRFHRNLSRVTTFSLRHARRKGDAMTDLRGKMAPGEVKMSATARLLGAVLVVAAVSAAGVYSFQSGMWKPHAQHFVSNEQSQTSSP
jgi:hypothetical protein